jgi:hypothetical protein
MGPIIE